MFRRPLKTAARLLAILLLTIPISLIPSCLTAEERDTLIYDAPHDEFRLLMILRDIQVESPDSLPHLGEVWLNRDHLLAPLVPGTTAFPYPLPWLIRADSHRALAVSFINPNASDASKILSSAADLNDIRITPGAFFMEADKLCYFHAMVVPGKIIDDLLKQINDSTILPETAPNAYRTELERRKLPAPAGRLYSWAQFKQQELTLLTTENKSFLLRIDGPDLHPITPLNVLDDQSLQLLMDRCQGKGFHLTRHAGLVDADVPLSTPDRDGLLDMASAWSKAVGDQVKHGKTGAWMSIEWALAQTANLTPSSDGIHVQVDLVRLYNAIATAMPARIEEVIQPEKPDPNAKPLPHIPTADVVKYLTDHKVPIENLTRAQIEKDFAAGTLKGFPSAAPIKPGTGLFTYPSPPPAPIVRPWPVANIAPTVLPRAGETYLIAPGDTLSALASRFHISLKALQTANPGLDPTHLQIGKRLHIPSP